MRRLAIQVDRPGRSEIYLTLGDGAKQIGFLAVSEDALFELLDEYASEAEERLRQVEQALLDLLGQSVGARSDSLIATRRELHTLKGNSGMMGFSDLQEIAHRMEDRVAELDPDAPDVSDLLVDLDRFRTDLAVRVGENRGVEAAEDSSRGSSEQGSAEGSVRIGVTKLNRILSLTTEMVVARNRLSDAFADASRVKREREGDTQSSEELLVALETPQGTLDKVLSEMQHELMDLRLTPLRDVLGGLRRLVHDEAQNAGKRVRFESRGEDTPLDKMLVEVAIEALGHLVRNAVVHGIEDTDTRSSAGKPDEGIVLVEAKVEAGTVQIDVVDDGGGIDRDALVRAAGRSAIESPEAADLQTLIFYPGLSSKESADRASGRGMGTAAVLEAVHRVGGTIDVETLSGIGTLFRLRLPIYASIISALLAHAGGEVYAIPIAFVSETDRFQPHRTSLESAQLTYEVRDDKIPLVELSSFFGIDSESVGEGSVVILDAEGRSCALLVDDLDDLQDIVVNELDPMVGRPQGVAGSTILGDGRVVLILDPRDLALWAQGVGEAA